MTNNATKNKSEYTKRRAIVTTKEYFLYNTSKKAQSSELSPHAYTE